MNKDTDKKVNEFDCIKMKQEIQEKMYREMSKMTYQEQSSYLTKHSTGKIKHLKTSANMGL